MNFRVRIKSYDKRKGCLVRRYAIDGKIYIGEQGWYEVEEGPHLALLRLQRQDPSNEHSPPIFDILTEGEAEQLEAAEFQARTGYAPISKPAQPISLVPPPVGISLETTSSASKEAAGRVRRIRRTG